MNTKTISGDQEVTIKELLNNLIKIKALLLEHKRLIILVSVIFGLIGLSYALLSKPQYIATITFMSTADMGAFQTSGLMKLAGDLGALSSGGPNVGAEKLVELLHTRRILEDALLKKVEMDTSGMDFLVNHYIRIFELNDDWDDHEILSKDFKFTTNDRDQFGIAENIVLGIILKQISKKVTADFTRKEIITLEFESTSENFSIKFAKMIIESLSQFYISKTIEQQQNTFQNLSLRIDTIKANLTNAELYLAKFKDETNRIVKAQGYLTELRLTREVQLLNAIFIESSKNLEIAKFSLLDKTPVIQIIDNPTIPIEPQKVSKKKALIIGGFLGFFLVSVVIIIKRKVNTMGIFLSNN